VEGASYEKQTSMSMCDELGPNQPFLTDWVEEYAVQCSTDGTNCDERALQYLEKYKTGEPTLWKQQMERLEALLDGGDMKMELKKWIKQRKKILGALLSEHESQAEEL